ncbi:hypothetical protein M5D96_000315 [Drosophila gunungcola]|uniref:Ionotropic receptor n=1 Tax=Drosophila gunungcola TaxID=103775 RepID=A0A9Q0BUD5_9MUSC|nr:hypothetical protein M5D96_000315 [Drosophila gunungcola]
MVCICQDTDVKLLNNLAMFFDHIRQKRIILWMQVKVTQGLLQELVRLVEEHKFIKLVIVDTENPGNGTVTGLHLKPFPRPYFERIENILKFKGDFLEGNINFQGKTAIYLPHKEPIIKYNISFGSKKNKFLITSDEERQIVEFAQRTNLCLKSYQDNRSNPDHFDFQLTPQIDPKLDLRENANSFTSVTLIVVVPCGKEKSVQEVFKQLDFKHLLLYLLPVYVTFMVVESVMHVVNSRISGQSHQLSFINPLVNLRAIGAILGLSITVRRGSSFSLRQLYLVLSIFGFVFSSFFACKLSALLTKHSRYAQIQNFEELRASGLKIIVDKNLQSYIKYNFGAKFSRQNLVTLKQSEVSKLIVSFNDSFAYITFKQHFDFLDQYQKPSFPKVLCSSKNLTIASNLPKVYYLPKDSMYKWPLRKFVHQISESGIDIYWRKDFINMNRKHLNISLKSMGTRVEAVPLSLQHFNWVWSLLLFGYGIAILVFVIEMVLGRNQNRKIKNQPLA